jgi:UDP-GlcNAc:undecaprenyl-phosphate GlcNAc-1-phosphate transferase
LTVLFLGTFAGSLVLSFISTKLVRDYSTQKGWVVAPAHDRHVHNNALPRLGGVAIVFSFLLTIAIVWLCQSFLGESGEQFSARPLLTILPPAILIFLLGVYDDLHSAGPYLKFIVQAIAGGMLFAGGLRILDLPLLFGRHQFSWVVGLLLTIFWVMAITNAFNLIDGLDGLAAGSALFSTLVMFVVALLSNASLISFLALALAGAVLGFLRYNFNPATIFLGDSGSLFIGFMLSALAIQGAQKAPTIVAVAIPVVSFGLPILETFLSVVRRFVGGRPVFTADREHIHHKLLQLGWSHRQAVIILYGVSALFALLSLFLLWPTGSTLGLILAVLGTGIWIGVQQLGYLEFGEIRRVAVRTIEQRHIFVNNLAIRRATEELKVAENFQQVARILSAAFEGNDFDAFELRVSFPASRTLQIVEANELLQLRWSKPESRIRGDFESAWRLSLDLMTRANQHCGTLTISRNYVHRDLQLDINLLTSAFPTALAEALHHTATQNIEIIPTHQNPALISVQAG